MKLSLFFAILMVVIATSNFTIGYFLGFDLMRVAEVVTAIIAFMLHMIRLFVLWEQRR